MNGICCTSTWRVNKQVLALTLFVHNSSCHVYDDCSMKKQPFSTAVVLEFRELLKWMTKSYWNFSELSECKHIRHSDRFIFYISLWVFHNSNKSNLKIHMFNCSTYCLCPIRNATNGSTSLLKWELLVHINTVFAPHIYCVRSNSKYLEERKGRVSHVYYV